MNFAAAHLFLVGLRDGLQQLERRGGLRHERIEGPVAPGGAGRCGIHGRVGQGDELADARIGARIAEGLPHWRQQHNQAVRGIVLKTEVIVSRAANSGEQTVGIVVIADDGAVHIIGEQQAGACQINLRL
ncbi:hypothetical protein RSP799_21540 [Ralstonia solanacearum]|nr:hypothetical protein RSP799_21540 [Ralstonia solanacearum]